MNPTKIAFAAVLLLGAALAAYFLFRPQNTKKQQADLAYVVKRGEFPITVSATGELNAKRSIKVRGPQGMRSAGIYQTTIADMVAEGTQLKAGDYVATLDRTELANKMSSLQTEIDQSTTQLEQARIDTAIELRALRDEIINTEFSKKEKQLALEQSRYEPQSVIQQAQLDLERTDRDYKQLLRKYELKQQQSEAKIQEINALLRQKQLQFDIMAKLSEEFTVMAPEDGMLIYARSWDGKKEPGSQVSGWDPVVAELPDLTDMISTTYVNEVDISRVREGQEVHVSIDAFPDKMYSGTVIKVANIGEQLRGYDAKVFEVIVQLHEVDSIMRPAMTTSNEIVTDRVPDVLSIPIEALQSDSLSFVFKRESGHIVRQEILPGLTNDNAVIVEFGLEEGDEVLLTVPEKTDDLPFVAVPQDVKEEIRRKLQADAERRQAEARKRKESVKDIAPPTPSGGSEGGIIIIN